MAILSQIVQAGSPVTAEIINNIVADLHNLELAGSPDFNLTLTPSGVKQNDTKVSKKIYSKSIQKQIRYGSPKGATWTFGENIKFNSEPRCWVQVMNTDTSRSASEFDFNIVITAVSQTSMTFQVRAGRPFKEGKHTFICFAAEIE